MTKKILTEADVFKKFGQTYDDAYIIYTMANGGQYIECETCDEWMYTTAQPDMNNNDEFTCPVCENEYGNIHDNPELFITAEQIIAKYE